MSKFGPFWSIGAVSRRMGKKQYAFLSRKNAFFSKKMHLKREFRKTKKDSSGDSKKIVCVTIWAHSVKKCGCGGLVNILRNQEIYPSNAIITEKSKKLFSRFPTLSLRDRASRDRYAMIITHQNTECKNITLNKYI